MSEEIYRKVRNHDGPGKGDADTRVTNREKFRTEFDRIFGKQPKKEEAAPNPPPFTSFIALPTDASQPEGPDA